MNPESTLNQLKDSLPAGKLPSSFGVYFKNTLVALCHALEDQILQTENHLEEEKPIVLVTFQKGKWYLQEAERYFQIAGYSQEIAIAAVPDSGFANHKTGKLDNVSLVNLKEDDALVNEWNLVILAPSYAAMLLCSELSEEEYHADTTPSTDIERKFYGLWTFDRALVEQTAPILIKKFSVYDQPLADRLQEMVEKINHIQVSKPVDLTGVVNRILSYLQTSQQQIVTVNRQTRELRELEGQALRLNRNLTANKLQAFLRMAQKIDERDKANPVASLQVAALSETLGQILDLPTVKLRRLRLAGILFRIGLAEAPNEVFTLDESQLDDASIAFWNDRAGLGAQLLDSMAELAPVTKIVKHHLEHWDGSGKPDGLKEEEIPIEARILGLVAYFQELTQTRGNRQALNLTEALEKCLEYKGTRFDPAMIESLTTVIRLTEMGLMTLPNRPSQLPHVWLEEATKSPLPEVSRK